MYYIITIKWKNNNRVNIMKWVNIMKKKIELLRKRLEKLISESNSLIDSEVIILSQELDKYIYQYYLDEDYVELWIIPNFGVNKWSKFLFL